MKALFKKRKKLRGPGGYCLELQDLWARKMTALTRDLSRARLLCALGLFVLVFGATSLYHLYKGLFPVSGQRAQVGIFSTPTRISPAANIGSPQEQVLVKKAPERVPGKSKDSSSIGEQSQWEEPLDLKDPGPIEKYDRTNLNKAQPWKRKH
ncbi:hypothetical protein [Flavobacterium sp. JAS]|uniref:hypothetical protein n=1 Tax=Flavobacterium sp. JAS TaxID=2897329 RepID=UPI001E45BAAE|nr:hypothetical protein [Flavobacterium sp. JAS]MCD0470599.1 hypothetical protein [Flavobacterium sp. JAS]